MFIQSFPISPLKDYQFHWGLSNMMMLIKDAFESNGNVPDKELEKVDGHTIILPISVNYSFENDHLQL